MQVNWPLGPRLPERGPRAMPSLQTNRSLEEGLSQRERGGSRSQDAMTDDRGSGGTLAVPSNEKSISIKELWVVPNVAGRKIGFLMDMGATYSVLTSPSGPLPSKTCTVTAVDGKP